MKKKKCNPPISTPPQEIVDLLKGLLTIGGVGPLIRPWALFLRGVKRWHWGASTEANDLLYKLGTGIFHAAVEVEFE